MDAGNADVIVTFEVNGGTLEAEAGQGVTVSGTATSLKLTGSVDAINSFLADEELTFATSLNSTENVTLTIEIDDQGNTGSGGDQIDTASLILEVTAVNDAPVNTVPGAQSIDQNSILTFSAGNGNQISVWDVDLGANEVEVTLTATNGLLYLADATGLTFLEGTTPDEFLRFTGTLDDVNTALNGMVFSPSSGFNGPASITITTDDQGFSGSGGSLSDTDVILITVNPINPVVISVTSVALDGSYKIGDELSISVNFSEAVTVVDGTPLLLLETGTIDQLASYVSGSGTAVLDFLYTVQEGDFSSDLEYLSTTALDANGAEINSATLEAILTLPEPGAANSLAANKDLIIDGIIPTVASVSVPADGSYVEGETLDFTLNFSEAVAVTGAPQISLTISSETLQATYVSGSGSSALEFSYSIQNGDLDSDGITIAGSIALNGGTIRDAAGNNANLTLNSVGSTEEVLVDAVAPGGYTVSFELDTQTTLNQSNIETVTFEGLALEIGTTLSYEFSSSTTGAPILGTATVSASTQLFNNDGIGFDLSSLGDGTITLSIRLTDEAGNVGPKVTTSVIKDSTAPAGYSVIWDELVFNATTVSSASFTLSGAEVGSTASYSISSDGDGNTNIVSGSVDLLSITQSITEDLSVLTDGMLTVELTLSDESGNIGAVASNASAFLDKSAPAGYSVSIITDRVNGLNQNNVGFNLIDGELGSDYSYSISSSGGGTPITGTGEVTSSTQLISGINVTSLLDGELTLTVTLTDVSGNIGEEVSDTVEKLLPAKLTIQKVEDADEDGGDGQFELVTDNTFAANTILTLELGGTADSGADYIPIDLTIVFPGNTSTVLIPITVIDDIDVEGDETVTIRLVSTDNTLVTIGEPDQATLTIADNDVPRQLTITPDANQQKVYGSTEPMTFSYSASGFDSGDDESIIQGALSRAGGEETGTYSFTLGDLDAGPNYEFILNPEVFTVTPATLTIEVDDLQKVYGGSDPDYTYTPSGFRRNDTVAILEGKPGRTEGGDVGTYAFNLGTLSAGANYNLQLISEPFQITPAPLTITADDQSKIFGQANPPLTFSYDGLVNGDTQVANEPSIATTATASSNAGKYPISLTGGSDPNYTISRVEGTLTIGQKAVTITADNQSKVYGAANPVLTFSYSGLLEGDTQIQTEPSITTDASISSNVGSYAITLSGGSDPNYDFTLLDGTLSVTPANLTITADDQTNVYGAANPVLTFTYDGLVNGDTEVASEPGISTTATAGSNVGSYPITLIGGSDQNYSITLVNGTLTIGQKALLITADDKSKVYGEANPTLTFSYDGLVNGDTQVATEPSIATTALQTSGVGNYPITLSGGTDQNYAITLENGTLSITPAPLTITADDQSKIFGQANPPLTFSYDGLVNGDTQVANEPSIATTATASSNAGKYPISLTGGSDPNYTISRVEGTLTINPAVLMITAEAKSKIFGNPDPELTFVAIGFKLSDTDAILTGGLTREPSEMVGTYAISQGTLDAGANYLIQFEGSELEIIPAEVAEFLTGDTITTPWSVDPTMPNQVTVLTQDGQIFSYDVTWDRSTLNVFKRGTYTVFGAVNLPGGVLNLSGQKAVLQVIVLAKPAPTDITLSDNQFIPNPSIFFQDVGFFTVVDRIDDSHTVELVPGAVDNGYFEIKSDILFWSNAEEAAGVTEFTILVRVTDRDGNVLEKSFTIIRDRKDISEIQIFNIFSPNNDGVNDTWGVPDLKYFSGARVQVFDRSGQRVFYTESPAIRWDGTFQGTEMPVGAYIWILESRETGEIRRGVLNLVRH